MKILHAFYSLTVGGAEILAVDLLNEMCKRHETHLAIVNSKWSKDLLKQLDPRVKVHFFNRQEGSRNPLPILKFNWCLLRLKPDIIHCHEPKMAKIILYRTPRLVHTIHDTGISADMYPKYHSLVAISDAVYMDATKRYNGSINKIYNGVNTAGFSRRSDYKMGYDKIKIVQISRVVHEKKGQDVLLQMAYLLKANYGYNQFKLHFVGVGPSVDYLKKLCRDLQLDEQVEFLGERGRPWLFQHLSTYHILVQPSRFEGFGLTILEGFAAGLPVLATDIEGPAEIISKTPRGILFQNENAEEGAAKLYELIKAYYDGKLERLMNAGKSVTETTYSINSCAEGYLAEYKRQCLA